MTVRTPKVQVGLSSTAAQNFTLDASAANGSIKLARGNAGATSQDILTVDAAGKVNFPASKAIESPVKDALNAVGDAPVYGCRAWVNFNGTGTVAIRASGNVSSITDNGTGNYTVNFMTAMPDTNYACAASGNETSGASWSTRMCRAEPSTTSGALVTSGQTSSATASDFAVIQVAVFR